jgi:heme exporter protein C
LPLGLYWGLIASPADYQQGEAARILYIHVPAAWLGLFCYAAAALCAGVYIVYTHRLADLAAGGFARVGMVFAGICLATGSIWGRPTWGAWWVWDARLTSVLLLFCLYGGYLMLRGRTVDAAGAAKRSAILLLIGALNLPIIKYSVEWWNTLHQPASITSIERLRDPALDNAMLYPLLTMALGLFALAIYLVLVWIEILLLQAKRERAMRLAMESA